MNIFNLKFVNVELTGWRSRENREYTTFAQLFSMSPQIFYPNFEVILSSAGKDWAIALEQLSALKTQSFYADDADRSAEFFIVFDFAYSNLSQEMKSEFMAMAKYVLL